EDDILTHEHHRDHTPTSRQSGPSSPLSRSSSCIPLSISRRSIRSPLSLDLDHPEVPQEVPHTEPDRRIVWVTRGEMIAEPGQFAFGHARDHHDRPLAMPAGHEDRHAPTATKSRLRVDEPGMNLRLRWGSRTDRKRHARIVATGGALR